MLRLLWRAAVGTFQGFGVGHHQDLPTWCFVYWKETGDLLHISFDLFSYTFSILGVLSIDKGTVVFGHVITCHH